MTLFFVHVLETAAEKDHPYFKMTLMFWAEDRAAWKSDIGTNWHWNLQAKAHIYVHNCVSIPTMHIRIYACLCLHYGKMPHAHISVHYHVCSFDKLLGEGMGVQTIRLEETYVLYGTVQRISGPMGISGLRFQVSGLKSQVSGLASQV